MFDAYHKWLGIAKDEQPPTHYRLLGVNTNEQDREVIEEAALKQMSHIRSYQLGPYATECTRLLNEIAQARATLLDAVKRKAYDGQLAANASRAARRQPKESITPTLSAAIKTASTRGWLLTCVIMVSVAGIAIWSWMLSGSPAPPDNIPKTTGKNSSKNDTGSQETNEPPSHLPFLAAVNDAQLVLQAKRDRQGAQDAAAQAELGDGWWLLAQQPKFGDLRQQLLQRARYWHVRALPNLVDRSRKAEVEDRAKLVVDKMELRPGLVAEVFEGVNHERRRGRRLDYTIAFEWGDDAPHANAPADNFSIRWVGWLKAPKPGAYILRFFAKDGFRFVIDGKTLIDEFQTSSLVGHREITVNLTHRPHEVRLDFVAGVGQAGFQWTWRQDGGAEEVVPADALYHDQYQREVLLCDYTPFEGKWVLNYTNTVHREYMFDDLGNVVNWIQGKVHRKRGEWIIDLHDDRLERVRFVDGQMRIDHYFPAATYPGPAPITAIGVRKT